MINSFDTDMLGAVVICLVASLIWAPIILVLASQLSSRMIGKPTGLIWNTALILAIAPTLITPLLAANGVSLRQAQAPLPPMAAAEIAPPTVFIPEIDVAEGRVAIDPYLTSEKLFSAAWLIYLYGGALAFGVWLMRWSGGQLAFARATRDVSPALQSDIDHWCNQIGVTRKPAVYRSTRITSVCMTGVIRPKIILPAKIDEVLSQEEIAVMCAHEIAHIKRYDGALFMAMAMVRTAFWFNPAIASLTTRIEQSAEEAADALVVNSGADRKLYANCFVEALKFAARRPVVRLAYAPSFTPIDREGRRKRLARILNQSNSASLGLRDRLAVIGIGGIVGTVAIAQAALAVAPGTLEPVTLDQIPLDGVVTAMYGFDASHPSGKFHNGVDIKAKQWTKIKAPADGTVLDSTDVYKNDPGWGKVIVIDHGNGLVTRYAHLGKCLVNKGDKVSTGDVVAKVGSTGRSTGPHLHFEVIQDGEFVDPLGYLDHDYRIATRSIKKKHLDKDGKSDKSYSKKENTKKAPFEKEPELVKLKPFTKLSELSALEDLSELNELKPLEALSELKDLDPNLDELLVGKKVRVAASKNTWNGAEKAVRIAEINAKKTAAQPPAQWREKTAISRQQEVTSQRQATAAKRQQTAARQQAAADVAARQQEEAARKQKAAAKKQHEQHLKRQTHNKKKKHFYKDKETLSEYRSEIADQIEAVRDARKDLEEAQREGLPGVENAIEELRASEKALLKAKKNLYTEQS